MNNFMSFVVNTGTREGDQHEARPAGRETQHDAEPADRFDHGAKPSQHRRELIRNAVLRE